MAKHEKNCMPINWMVGVHDKLLLQAATMRGIKHLGSLSGSKDLGFQEITALT